MAIITPEFSEAEYQCLVESVFVKEFQDDGRYDIDWYSGTDERDLGFDLKIKTPIPIYLQVKRSYAFEPGIAHQLLEHRRTEYHYNDDSGAYLFRLHVDRITKDYHQHSLLVDLCDVDFQYARYIAPLFHTKAVMNTLKYNIMNILWDRRSPRHLRHRQELLEWNDYVLLQNSISIKPHKKAAKEAGTHHKYLYNKRYQTSFHSTPEPVSNLFTAPLSDLISSVKQALNNTDGRQGFDKIYASISNALLEEEERHRDSFVGAMQVIQESISEGADYAPFETLAALEPTFENYRLLAQYIREMHGVNTYLLSVNDAYRRHLILKEEESRTKDGITSLSKM